MKKEIPAKIQYYCDRCENQVENTDSFYTNIQSYYQEFDGEEYDLCSTCSSELINFLGISRKCNYNIPWVGWCNNNQPCPEHDNLKCKCGKKATHGCSMASSLVCGRPLCDNCSCNH